MLEVSLEFIIILMLAIFNLGVIVGVMISRPSYR